MNAPTYPPYLARPGGPRARGASRDALRSAAYEEASHATAFAAENFRVLRLSVDGRGGGRCRTDQRGRRESAAALAAGQVGAALFAETGPQSRLRHEDDDAQIREATGGRRDLRERAEREARNILLTHARTVRAIAERLLAVGTLEGAELDALLFPVRAAFVRRCVT